MKYSARGLFVAVALLGVIAALLHRIEDSPQPLDAHLIGGTPGDVSIGLVRVRLPFMHNKDGGVDLYLTNDSSHTLHDCLVRFGCGTIVPLRGSYTSWRPGGFRRAHGDIPPGEKVYLPFNFDFGQSVRPSEPVTQVQLISKEEHYTWRIEYPTTESARRAAVRP